MAGTATRRDGAAPDTEVTEAIRRSRLGRLPRDVLERIVAGARDVEVPAGRVLVLEGAVTPFAKLVIRGLMRTYMTSADGRQLTIRYSHPGALIGVPSLFSVRGALAGLQALTDARLLVLHAATLQRLADTDARVARALLEEASDLVYAYMEAVASATFSSLRQRVVRHLLDVAATSRQDGMLVARVSQQDLAYHVGSVREVVVRILRELREEGLIRTARGEIVLTDPARLHAGTWSRSR